VNQFGVCHLLIASRTACFLESFSLAPPVRPTALCSVRRLIATDTKCSAQNHKLSALCFLDVPGNRTEDLAAGVMYEKVKTKFGTTKYSRPLWRARRVGGERCWLYERALRSIIAKEPNGIAAKIKRDRRGSIAMKISRILPVVGILTLLACGAAFAQSPNQIPPGAGVGVNRQPPGSEWRNPTNPPPATAQPSATSRGKRAISLNCSQQADAKGLHGKAR
jgi:hypothetical protein